jgi:hypothetical protein
MDDKFVEMALLYDFYGKILTAKQQEIIDLYYMRDFSLGEIGELLMTSRQAVYDNLKRAEKQLKDLEDRLGLIRRFKRDEKLWTQTIKRLDGVIKALDKEHSNNDTVTELQDIREFIRSIIGG